MSEERKNMVTPSGQVVFIKNLFDPNEDGKYSASLIFNTDTDLKAIKNLMTEKARETFDEATIKSKSFKWAVKRPTAETREQYDFMDDNTLILNASTKFQVEVKGNTKGSDNRYETLLDGDLEAGDYCRALVSAYTWEFKGKKGVSLNLNAVQLVKKGEALYSRTPSDSYFDETDFDIEVDTKVENTSGEVDGDDAFGDDW